MSKRTKLKSKNWKIVFDNESNDFLVHTNCNNSIGYTQTLNDAILKLEDYLKWTAAPQIPVEAPKLKLFPKVLISSKLWRIVKQDDFYYVQIKDKVSTKWSSNYSNVSVDSAYDSLESAVLRVIELLSK